MRTSLDDYDQARAEVETAKAEMEAAKAAYEAAEKKYHACAHGLGLLRLQLNEQLKRAAEEVGRTSPGASSVVVRPRGGLRLPFDAAPSTTIDEGPPQGPVAESQASVPAMAAGRRAPSGVRASLWELVNAIPLDGPVAIADLREALAIGQGALNSRIVQAKATRLIENAGWGQYKLTEEGRRIRSGGLRVVENP